MGFSSVFKIGALLLAGRTHAADNSNIAIVNLNGHGFVGTVQFQLFPSYGSGNDVTNIKLFMSSVPDITGQTPYPWHVHEKPVNSTGSCMSTGYHLDPVGLNPDGKNPNYLCVPSDQPTCEMGDLSGKYGKLNPYNLNNLSFYDPNLPFYGPNGIVGRSLVIHLANSTRIVCGNIVQAPSDYNPPDSYPGGSGKCRTVGKY